MVRKHHQQTEKTVGKLKKQVSWNGDMEKWGFKYPFKNFNHT
jgi:hypothetical protein